MLSQNRVLSPHSGDLIEGEKTLGNLIRHALVDVFKRPLNVPAMAKSLRLLAGELKVEFLTFGPCNVGRSFKEVISPAQIEDVATSVFHGLQARSPGTKPDEIAVIGMAGRFPGAATLAEFWSTLENGIDTCKKVRLVCVALTCSAGRR